MTENGIGDNQQAHAVTRDAWNTNAAYWDERMGDGNDFVNVLIWPATERLLQPKSGKRILEIACGNGLYARRLAALGAEVVGVDFSSELITIAKEYDAHREQISYQVVDATDEQQLRQISDEPFDAALCQMALFDMSEIEPLMKCLPSMLKPSAPFVFSIVHPCFNNNSFKFMAEREDRDGVMVTTYSLNISAYMSPSIDLGLAIGGQPVPHVYFHRPLSQIMEVAFRHGWVLNGMEERAFPPDYPQGSSALTWGGNYSEFPPVLVMRLVQVP